MWAYVQRGRKKLKLSSAHAFLPRDFSHGGLRLQLLPALSLDWPCGWTGFGLEFGFGFGGGSWRAPRASCPVSERPERILISQRCRFSERKSRTGRGSRSRAACRAAAPTTETTTTTARYKNITHAHTHKLKTFNSNNFHLKIHRHALGPPQWAPKWRMAMGVAARVHHAVQQLLPCCCCC